MKMKKAEIKYENKSDSIIFHCTGIGVDRSELITLNEFICDMSKNKKVFFHGYRMPEQALPEMIDQSIILSNAGVLLDPFNVFFHLSKARVYVENFDWACEASIYYFDKSVEWADFLATSVILRPIELIRKGILSAHFTSVDHGADFWFECNKAYETRVFQMFNEMSCFGYRLIHTSRLIFPYL